MSINVLNLKVGVKNKYAVSMNDKASIEGAAMCIIDERFKQGTSSHDAWDYILKASGTNDSIVYVASVLKGYQQQVYVGKTLGTFSNRYRKGATGGLLKVFDFYDPKGDILDCTLYNVSYPALVEGWCYQILMDKKISVTNIQDPS
jgi:hypothetical protein